MSFSPQDSWTSVSNSWALHRFMQGGETRIWATTPSSSTKSDALLVFSSLKPSTLWIPTSLTKHKQEHGYAHSYRNGGICFAGFSLSTLFWIRLPESSYYSNRILPQLGWRNSAQVRTRIMWRRPWDLWCRRYPEIKEISAAIFKRRK